ncbi:carboxymuconolactone decarboxylase family protein, partial [Rhizobium leguminosarum]|uniref:carboxymuconolactone decarboxylase family protein n=1 Tax=Rhizobium leguminosarum TaxID=384 RepID=UPI003F9CF6FB
PSTGQLRCERDGCVRTGICRRGKVAAEDIDEVRAAGYGEDEIIEIILHVALNTWKNYLNNTADTDIDFPIAIADPPHIPNTQSIVDA